MADQNDTKEVKIGAVFEALPNTMFRVRLDDGQVVLTYLGGKMRHFRITVLVGDKVKVEMNPYDASRGRIIQRL